MIEACEIVNSLIDLLRDIPELVDEVSGDENRIYAYDDRYPQNENLRKAIHSMKSPSIMVAYRSFGPGSMDEGQPINHKIEICARPGMNRSCHEIGRLLVDGVPKNQPLPMFTITVLDDLDPMVLETDWEPQEDAEGMEFWMLTISFNEKWG
jgi:hypothetical protein